MKEKFRVEFLEEAADFLETLDDKAKEKVLYNIWKARITNDKKLFKKLSGEIWEFRTLFKRRITDCSLFGTKQTKRILW